MRTLPEILTRLHCWLRGHKWEPVQESVAARLQRGLFGSFTQFCPRCGNERVVRMLGLATLSKVTQEHLRRAKEVSDAEPE